LRIVLAQVSGNAQGANELAIHHERHSTLDRHGAFEPEDAQTGDDGKWVA
jgi:hypothetical protein